jgi:hypothetical protein
MTGKTTAGFKDKPGDRIRSFQGILTMVDCGGTQLKLRIERKRGKDVIALGDLSFLPLAARSLRRQVSVRGKVSAAKTTGKTWRMQMRSLNSAETSVVIDEDGAKLERTLAAGREARRHKTVEELASEQGVKPIENVEDLFGGWPGEVDDGFEEWIREERQSHKPREIL